MKGKNTRPKLRKNLKSKDFKEYYFLKEELKEFCKNEGLKTSGSKNELEMRIIHYLDNGELLEENEKSSTCPDKNCIPIKDEENKIHMQNKNKSQNKSHLQKEDDQSQNKNQTKGKDRSSQITLDSILGENFKCSEDKREFFEKEIGKGFKFKVKFQKWLKSNPDKTYRDAINAYHEIQSSKEKTKIDQQFQYNQYIRDFFEDNDNKTLEDAIKCWNYKKSLRGHNKYESSDLDALSN